MGVRKTALASLAILAVSLWPGAAGAQDATRPEPVLQSFPLSGQPLWSTATVAPTGTQDWPTRARESTAIPAQRPRSRGSSAPPDHPKIEIYGGFAYMNVRLAALDERKNAIGWGASVTGYFNRYFGLTGDFGGQYNAKCSQNDVNCIVRLLTAAQIVDYSDYEFLGGPQLRIPGERFTGFVHALFGGARTHVSLLDTTTGTQTVVNSGARFAMGFGGGVNWNVGTGIAIRLLQFDYMPVHEVGAWRHDFRIQGGVVLQLGGGS